MFAVLSKFHTLSAPRKSCQGMATNLRRFSSPLKPCTDPVWPDGSVLVPVLVRSYPSTLPAHPLQGTLTSCSSAAELRACSLLQLIRETLECQNCCGIEQLHRLSHLSETGPGQDHAETGSVGPSGMGSGIFQPMVFNHIDPEDIQESWTEIQKFIR